MLKIEGKTFMNIQEAVQWLLENNALPFQCTVNYAGNTEIGMGTIVNPSPAKVRIGSLIFFADSKVSTVVGITENGFICSDQYNNLVDDVAYVTNVAINASGHLITTFSDGQTQDAGLIKQITSISINASQHLIATFNDGTTTDLGAIFSGNVNISGILTASNARIFENIEDANTNKRFVDYVGTVSTIAGLTGTYCRASLSGTHLLVVLAGTVANGTVLTNGLTLATFALPTWILNKIIPVWSSYIERKETKLWANDWTSQETGLAISKGSNLAIVNLSPVTLTADRNFRVQFDLLIDNA